MQIMTEYATLARKPKRNAKKPASLLNRNQDVQCRKNAESQALRAARRKMARSSEVTK
jgi:hypothetical protein